MRVHFWSLAAALVLSSTPGQARVEHSLNYTKSQSYHAALRYLRVDHGYQVTEKDMDSGYLLFEYPSSNGGEPTSGSIEVIERGSTVTLVVQLPKMPLYHERILARGLLEKLRSDYGTPPKSRDEQRDPPGSDEKKDSSQEKEERPSGPPVRKAP